MSRTVKCLTRLYVKEPIKWVVEKLPPAKVVRGKHVPVRFQRSSIEPGELSFRNHNSTFDSVH